MNKRVQAFLDKMVPLCVGDLIAKAIYRIHHNEPVSVLFE